MTIHSSGQTISNFPYIEGITPGISEKISEVVRRAVVMGMNRKGEGCDKFCSGWSRSKG